ncbi:HPF/RaiA family ribosome-associated protein [Pedobacter sp. Du54]|uniref:HPF/RaiA family ribosome-associated protein n=1 Tax=Pedobacter anseongensis TaxID=3133439 RepID=UPI0030A3F3AD
MNIQINTDKNLTIHAEYQNQIEEQLTSALARFEDHISSVQVHLSDENGNKDGQNDKKCVIEAHLKGKPAVIGTTFGETYDLAITGALTKLKNALTTIDGKMKAHH